jgi:hypothetical protein
MSPGVTGLDAPGPQDSGEVDRGAVLRQQDGDLLRVDLEAVDRQADLHGGLLDRSG